MAYEGNRYAGIVPKQHESMFAKVVDPAASAVGAAAGFLIGGPPGAVAGYQIGHSLGDTAQGMANGDMNAQRVVGNAAGAMGGFKGFQTPQTAITPSQGVNPPLPQPSFDPSAAPSFIQGPQDPLAPKNPWDFYALGNGVPHFALGGVVPNPQALDQIMRMLASQQQGMAPTPPTMPAQPLQQPDMTSIRQQAVQAVGPAPTQPQEIGPSHPTWDALSQIIPQVLAAMPKPANPKNTKAIGAWLPAAAVAGQATGQYFRGKRDAANKAAQTDYEARQKAYEANLQSVTGKLVDNATQRFAQNQTGTMPNQLDKPMTEEEALRVTGDKAWAGFSIRQWNSRKREPKPGQAVSSTTISPRAKRIAEGIIAGNIRPGDISKLPPRDPARAEVMDVLATRGYDMNNAQMRIDAEKKFWQTQNDSKRTSMRTLLGTLQHSIPYTRTLIQRAKEIIPDFAVNGINKAALDIAVNMPGERGALAKNLRAQILDISSEIGGLYMGGNSNTDESFRVAQSNLSADWNEESLLAALDQIEVNAGIRKAAMQDVGIYRPEKTTPAKPVNAY